jgi:pimeloyl-ACP methyl ester carboxylesterase
VVLVPFVERNGVRIHYEVEGTGPPIVLIPGLGGSLEMWPYIGRPGLFPDHQLILVDPRGHGRSDKPRDPAAHRIEEYRDDVRAVMDATHTDRALLWGISDGSKIGIALADKYPERVAAQIDHDGLGGCDLCDLPERQGRLDAARLARGKSGALLEYFAKAEGYAVPPALVKEMQSNDPEMVASELVEWTHWKGPLSILPRLRAPMLMLMNGLRDAAERDRVKQATGDKAEVYVFPGVGHLRLCFELEHTLPRIRAFVSRVQP